MKRTPYLSLLLSLAVLGGMLVFFPTVWVLLLVAFIILVSLQVIIVRRHLYPIERGQRGSVVYKDSTLNTGAHSSKNKRSRKNIRPPQADKDAAESPGIDSSIFSKFRQHLESAENPPTAQSGDGDQAPPAATPAEPGAVEDRVNISRASKQKGQQASDKDAAPEEAPKPLVEGDLDIFEDLRAQDLSTPRTRGLVKKANKGAKKTTSTDREAPAGESAPKADARKRKTPGEMEIQDNRNDAKAASGLTALYPRPETRETGLQLADADSANKNATKGEPSPDARGAVAGGAVAGGTLDSGNLQEDAEALLKLAEDALANKDAKGAKAGVDNYFQHLVDAPELISWRAHQVMTRLTVLGKAYPKALEHFEDMLKANCPLEGGKIASLLQNLIQKDRSAGVNELRVSMLVRILAKLRQTKNPAAMDEAYQLIIKAQERGGDDEKLIQYLKNHLELRKAMRDVPGQLEVIDQLGKHTYKLGMTEEAKLYYEMGLKLRGEKPGGAAPDVPPGKAGDDGTGTSA